MLHRKEYKAIAQAINEADKDLIVNNVDEFKEGLVRRLCSYFVTDNPNFDKEKFRKACGTISFDESNQ